MSQLGRNQDANARVVLVLVVDDQAPFRVAARAVIARVLGFEPVAEATSGYPDTFVVLVSPNAAPSVGGRRRPRLAWLIADISRS